MATLINNKKTSKITIVKIRFVDNPKNLIERKHTIITKTIFLIYLIEIIDCDNNNPFLSTSIRVEFLSKGFGNKSFTKDMT